MWGFIEFLFIIGVLIFVVALGGIGYAFFKKRKKKPWIITIVAGVAIFAASILIGGRQVDTEQKAEDAAEESRVSAQQSSTPKPAVYSGKLSFDAKTLTADYNLGNLAKLEIPTKKGDKLTVADASKQNNKQTYRSDSTDTIPVWIKAKDKPAVVTVRITHSGRYKTALVNVKPDPQSAAKAASESASSIAAAASKSSAKASSQAAAAASSKALAEAAAKAEANKYNTGITYEQIARNPDSYSGKMLHLTGEVLQSLEDDGNVNLRVAINGEIDDVVLVEFDDSILHGARILEDDLVTFYGTSLGTQDYESTMGATITVPLVEADKITDSGKAPDDYGY